MTIRKRTGFTTIELLVVVGILAILLGLVMAAVVRVQTAQQIRSAQDTVQKVQVAVDTQVKAIIGQAQSDIRGQGTSQDAVAVLNFMGGDEDTAMALLVYIRLRQSFPQSFYELQNNNINGYPLLVKSQFINLQSQIPAGMYPVVPQSPADMTQQSALLLYAAVSQSGAGGSTFTSDAMNAAQTQVTIHVPVTTTAGGNGTVTGTVPVTGTVYMDVWKQPIGFARFGTNAELQNPPYIDQNNKVSLDPYDPAGKLIFWTQNNIPNNKASSAAQYIFCTTAYGDPANSLVWDGTNRRPIVYSNGPNQVYECLNYPNNPNLATATLTNKTTYDDILGYQLTQLGYKGTN